MQNAKESVSGLHAYRASGQITEEEFQQLNNIAYKLENGLLIPIESIEHKRDQGEWIDHLGVKETNALYGLNNTVLHDSMTPALGY